MILNRSPRLNIQVDDIHLWVTQPQFIQQKEKLALYRTLLSPSETEKQQRYRFEKDRHIALITRAFVRDLLSHYAEIPAENWRFEKGAYDKPEIINPPIPLRFNISHTEDMVICAVTLIDDIGCDVEMINRSGDLLSLVDHYFSITEVKELHTLPENQKNSRFFDYWTLKESYIKACGQGLSIPLADFSFYIGSSQLKQVNNNIKLSFALHRNDRPEIWRNWLFYPNNQHRVALSIKSEPDNQARPYRIRYFKSIPLVITKELSWLGESLD